MVNLHQLYDSVGTTSMRYDSEIQASISFYGYSFVVLNIIQGAFIFGFHCLQNERVNKLNSSICYCFHCLIIFTKNKNLKQFIDST